MRVYIAGPMRGYPGLNFSAFDAASERLREIGHEPVSPAEMDRQELGITGNEEIEGNGQLLHKFLERDFRAIDTCDAIALIDGWKESSGANAERAYAQVTGKRVYRLRMSCDGRPLNELVERSHAATFA